ncbi:MAG: hypothetical protein WDZ40_03545 [Candidatus Spechtbacterales bacterium]
MGQRNDQCVIRYTTGVNESGYAKGYRLTKNDFCCRDFFTTFCHSGNKKAMTFDEVSGQVQPGLNFTQFNGKLAVTLATTRDEIEVKFCPFCAAEIILAEDSKVLVS